MTDIIIIKDADEDTIKRILNGKKTETTTSKPEGKPEKEKLPKEKAFVPYKNSKAKWTKKELKTLKTYYTKGEPDWELLKQLLPNRTESAMKWRASSLGLSKTQKGHKKNKETIENPAWTVWTKKEIRILKKYYPHKGKRIDWKLITSLLPNRTKSSIMKRVSVLGISNKYRKLKIEKAQIEVRKSSETKKGSVWTNQEEQILKDNYSQKGKVNWKTLQKLLPNRTKASISMRASELKVTQKHRTWKQQKKVDGRKNRIVPRYQIEAGLKAIDKYHKFTKERSITYQKNGYNEPDSRRMAIADWHKQGHTQIQTQPTTEYKPTTQQIKAKVPENFPEFETISHDFNTLLEGITKHIVGNQGTKLTFLNTRDILDIENGRAWHNFVMEFMVKSPQIAEYFNVPNKFKHIRNGDFDIIIYES